MNEIKDEKIKDDENTSTLKEDLETCKNESKLLKTRISEVTREKEEAFSQLRSSERKVYTLSFVICIVAFGFTAAFSTRQGECQDNLVISKEEIKALIQNHEVCMVDLAGCNSILYDIKQEMETDQAKAQQCNNMLASTQKLLEKCKGKKCVKEDKFNQINDKLEICTNDLNNSKSKKTKHENIDKQPIKMDKKQKKCQSCQRDTESFNKQGVHILKGRVLQVIRVERPWRMARKDCQERGGDLAVPKNVDKLAEYLLDKEPENNNFWIGISDLKKKEEFLGVNGGRVVGGWEEQNMLYRTQNTEHKNPGNDCVRLTYTNTSGKGLVATHCDAGMHYICDMAPSTKHDIFH